jgi:DNA-binding NarL/FixJ family response regulator
MIDTNHKQPIQWPIRVLLVDDYALIRHVLRSLLEEHPNVEVVAEATNGEEAVMLAERLRPSVVIMDINMPRMNGIQATAKITARNPELAVVGLSLNEGEHGDAILRAGAKGFVAKETAVERLYTAIVEAVTKLGSWRNPRRQRQIEYGTHLA